MRFGNPELALIFSLEIMDLGVQARAKLPSFRPSPFFARPVPSPSYSDVPSLSRAGTGLFAGKDRDSNARVRARLYSRM